MLQVFETLCCFSSRPFLKQLASHVSSDTLKAEFTRYEVFSHPSWELKHFLEGFKVRCVVLMNDKSSHIKKCMMVKYDVYVYDVYGKI